MITNLQKQINGTHCTYLSLHVKMQLKITELNFFNQHNTAHGEENWTRIYARFGDDIRRAKTDKARQKAIQETESIYGGMGSWNDFYLQALGEAESKRTSLSTAISHQCSALSDLMAQPPYPPKTGLWQSFLRYLGT